MATATVKFTLEEAFKTSDLSPDEQSHLVRVYTVLVAGAITTAWVCGYVLLEMPESPHHWALWWKTLLVSIVATVWFFCESSDNIVRRFVVLMVLSACTGLNFVSLNGLFFGFESTTVLAAFVLIPVVFVCFAVTASLTVRRPVLFASGLVSSILMIVAALHVLVWVDGKSTVNEITPYWFLVYLFFTMVFNTQATAEKFTEGQQGVLENSLAYVVNFLNLVFTVILMLLKHVYRLICGGKTEEYEPLV